MSCAYMRRSKERDSLYWNISGSGPEVKRPPQSMFSVGLEGMIVDDCVQEVCACLAVKRCSFDDVLESQSNLAEDYFNCLAHCWLLL